MRVRVLFIRCHWPRRKDRCIGIYVCSSVCGYLRVPGETLTDGVVLKKNFECSNLLESSAPFFPSPLVQVLRIYLRIRASLFERFRSGPVIVYRVIILSGSSV